MDDAVSLDELRLEIAEILASRARVVTAADGERRRIERDLHDGVQQHLVALAVNLQLARQLVDSDPTAAKILLAETSAGVREALESVRELAQRVYPPLLLDRGLAEALHAIAAASDVPARVEAGQLDRHPAELEATVYFCCLEALENVARHAGEGARATVRVWSERDALLFDVTDDGAGFDPAGERGSGLDSMSDRLGAFEGSLTIDSEPERGTRVSGRIPLPS